MHIAHKMTSFYVHTKESLQLFVKYIKYIYMCGFNLWLGENNMKYNLGTLFGSSNTLKLLEFMAGL